MDKLTANSSSRPVPIIRNLPLFGRILSDPSVARTGDDLFRFVAANGGKASDYDNLVAALRAFGAYKRSGEPGLAYETVLNPEQTGWLHQATANLYADVIEPEFLDLGGYYGHPDSLAEVRAKVDAYWGYSPTEARRVVETLRIVHTEIKCRTERRRRRERLAAFLGRVIGAAALMALLLAMGFCSQAVNRGGECDYDGRGMNCYPSG